LYNAQLLAYLSKRKEKKSSGNEILETDYDALTRVYLQALVKVHMQGIWFDNVVLKEKPPPPLPPVIRPSVNITFQLILFLSVNTTATVSR
jgi:hypothetical protein